MRDYERALFSYLCCGGGEWYSKTNTSIARDAVVNPHPSPLAMGEGDKKFSPVSQDRRGARDCSCAANRYYY
jgi:hypothetical protein